MVLMCNVVVDSANKKNRARQSREGPTRWLTSSKAALAWTPSDSVSAAIGPLEAEVNPEAEHHSGLHQSATQAMADAEA